MTEQGGRAGAVEGLDLTKPPKYCPQCQKSDVKSKVKKFRMSDGSLVIMCKSDKCPWPFSEYSKEEVTIDQENNKEDKKAETIPVELATSAASTKTTPAAINEQENKKKRKKDKVDAPTVRVSPEGKKIKVKEKHNGDKANKEHPSTIPCSTTVKTFCDKDALHNDSPSDSSRVQVTSVELSDVGKQGVSPNNAAETPKIHKPTVCSPGSSKQGGDEDPPPPSDDQFFTAIPVAVRQPLRLPKHAAHILDSRILPDPAAEEGLETDSVSSDDGAEAGDLDELDLEGSDSELESLVSECSTMSTVSDVSVDGRGSGAGKGKIKKRGKKKKRKDRRKQHTGKCSKEMCRGSDIGGAVRGLDTTPGEADISDANPDITNSCMIPIAEAALAPPADSSALHENASPAPTTTEEQETSAVVEDGAVIDENVEIDFVVEEDADMEAASSYTDDDYVEVNEADLDWALAQSQAATATGETDGGSNVIIHKDDEVEVVFIQDDGGHQDQERIGRGDRPASVSFLDKVTGTSAKFPVVHIEEDEAQHLVNVVLHQASKYKLKFHNVAAELVLESRFVVSAGALDRNVVKHVEKCFTKRSINKYKIKGKRKGSPRKKLEKIVQGKPKSNEVLSPLSKTDAGLFADLSPQHVPAVEHNEPSEGSSRQETNRNQESRDEEEETISVFKKPLDPVRSYQSPRADRFHHRADWSPRRAMSPTKPVASPQYCYTLMDPLSPMPATPKAADGGGGDGDEAVSTPPRNTLGNGAVATKSQQEHSEINQVSDNSLHESQESGNNAVIVNNANSKQNSENATQSQLDLPEEAEEEPSVLQSLSNRLMMNFGIDIEATMVSEESSVHVPTLALLNFEEEDSEYGFVKKVGSGTTERLPGDDVTVAEETELSNCVFHVAQSASISLPERSGTLEIKKHGTNKIFLTSDSDKIEAHNMQRKDTVYHVKVRRPKAKYGDGWFIWKDWKVDTELLSNFHSYLEGLKEKWNSGDYIRALLDEKHENQQDEHLDDIITFFVHVFMKVYYMKKRYGVRLEKGLDFVRTRYGQEQKVFQDLCREVFEGMRFRPESVDLRKVLSNTTVAKLISPKAPAGHYIQTLPPGVAEQMASSVLGAGPISLKHEPREPVEPTSVQSVVGTPNPANTTKSEYSVGVNTHGTSVAMLNSVETASPEESPIGSGTICLQFFFENPLDGTKTSFKPVYVRNDDDVNSVVALVSEKAGDYKHRLGLIKKPVNYYSEAVKARSRLEPQVVRYIEQCFTKRGMKELRAGYKKKSYPRRRRNIIVLPKSDIKNEKLRPTDSVEEIDEAEVSQDEEEEEFEEPVEKEPLRDRYISDDDDTKRVLEARVFGRKLPKVKIREKALKRTSKQWHERGLHDKANSDKALLAVDMMLDRDERGPKSSLKLSSLLKPSRRRARPRQDSSPSSSDSDEQFFDENKKSYYVNKDNQNVRTSKRLRAKYDTCPKSKSISGEDSEEERVPSEEPGSKSVVAPPTESPSPTRRVTFSSISTQEISEISRSLSRLSRPNSADYGRPDSHNSRPGSSFSRPSSQLSDRPASRLLNKSRRHFGVKIDEIEEPKPDSPVRTPKLRHQEKAAKAAQESLFPRTKSPFSTAPSKDEEEIEVPAAALSTPLQKFDQVNVRKSKQKKVEKMLEKQKKKAEKNEKKRLRGYGEKSSKTSNDEKSSDKTVHVKKSAVTKEESDLIANLLLEAEMAVKSEQKVNMTEEKTETAMVQSIEYKEDNNAAASSSIADFELAAHGIQEDHDQPEIDEILSTL